MNFNEFVSKVGGPVQTVGQNQFRTNCPVCGDQKQHLYISQADGKLLLDCKRGCLFKDIIAAVGGNEPRKKYVAPPPPKKVVPMIPKYFQGSKVVKIYDYINLDGTVSYHVLRTEDKKFPQLSPVLGGYAYGFVGEKIPYRLPEFSKASLVCVCEGEKDVDNVTALGIAATCMPCGAGRGKWDAEWNAYFTGKVVAILVDNDATGMAYSQVVADALANTTAVKVIMLPGLKEHGDVSDWIQDGGTKEALLDIISKTALYTITPDVIEPDHKDPGLLPPALFESLPTIAKSALDFYCRSSVKRQPELFLASFLAFTGTLAGHKFCSATDMRTNMYVCCIAESGQGKESIRQAIKVMSDYSGTRDFIGPEDIASDAGLMSCMIAHNPILFAIDEFGLMLNHLTKSGTAAPHLSKITDKLLSVYTSVSDRRYKVTAYADSAKNKEINQPHCCILGTTTPSTVWRAVSSDSVEAGLLSRILFVQGRRSVRSEYFDVQTEPPQDVVAWMKELHAYKGSALSVAEPICQKMPATDEATALIRKKMREYDEKGINDDDRLSVLWTRANEQAIKLAMLYSLWDTRDFQSVMITEKAYSWACSFIEHSIEFALHAISHTVADTAFQAKSQEVYRFIKGKGSVERSAVARRFGKFKSRELDEVLQSLQEQNRIEKEVIAGGQGRPKTRIKAL